ncbi:MAG: TonB-dependent receptor [Cryomorphaceae bacterium]|nr:TonB-dependent receptor [Cryomorphaceae bacterium]
MRMSKFRFNQTFLQASFALAAFVFTLSVNAQQTIRGEVRDAETGMELIGANVVILDHEPVIGSATDEMGHFILRDVPLGRVNVKVFYLGYAPRVIKNVLVTAGKEVVLRIDMEMSFYEVESIEVTHKVEQGESSNEFATTSARTFSVDETKRFAGSLGDPARMVSSFAGVASDPAGNNDIVVRGNSPKGILWKLEGVEIPNPNHFAAEGATGGPINAINVNMLANSDFFTGAFAPEYGNASSGVMDMKFRTGNHKKHERSFTIGALGVEANVEGPLSAKSNSSYIANYRYSSLAMMDNLGLVDFSGVPKYQDVAFKINIPTKKYGRFSLFGMGGVSSIRQSTEDSLGVNKLHADFTANMGVVGVNHVFPLSQNAFLTNSISAMTNGNGAIISMENESLNEKIASENLQRTSYRASSSYTLKVDSRNTLKTGVIYAINAFDFYTEMQMRETGEMERYVDEKGQADLLQSYVSWKYRFTEKLTITGGFHTMTFLLNNSHSIEPRAGLTYRYSDKQTFTAGYGRHSRLEPMTLFFANVPQEDGSTQQSNRGLGFGKADHFVGGYRLMLAPNLMIKTEAYYQFLHNIPVDADPTSPYSMINSPGWFTTRALVNGGYGRNYGVELTAEKLFSNNYFFLSTLSLYQSEFKTLENQWRETMFNGNYITNFLFGKEFVRNKDSKKVTYGISGKVLFAGGMRYTPIDLEASKRQGMSVRDDRRYLSLRADDLFMTNVVFYIRKDKKKTTHEFRIDIQNVTNNQAFVNDYYNPTDHSIVKLYQLPMMPNIAYKIDF